MGSDVWGQHVGLSTWKPALGCAAAPDFAALRSLPLAWAVIWPFLSPALPPLRGVLGWQLTKLLVRLPGCGAAGVWFQDDLLYHNSLFHASHHLSPVAASGKEVLAHSWLT